ncbi:MAG: SseB family protein [Pseudomonadota bacterium]
MTQTPLDLAWIAAEAAHAGDAGMARYYDIFAATEFHLLIDAETLGSGAPQPQLFPVEGVDTALIFDTETRLAAFAEGGAHLTLTGRAVVGMFAGAGVQLGVNLGDAPSATILPAEAVDWAASALRQPIEAADAETASLTIPRGVMPDMLMALDQKLAAMGAAVAEGWLCGLGRGLILCLVLRTPRAEQQVVAAMAETARFHGGDKAAFDIAVLSPSDPKLEAARRVGLGFQPADPADAIKIERAAPGMDPSKPPKLT